MFDLRKIPMLRVLVPFFCGVYTGVHLNEKIESARLIILLLIVLLVLLVTVFVIFKWQRQRPAVLPWINSLLLCLLLYGAGVGTGIQSKPRDPGLPVDQWVLVRGELCGSAQGGHYGYEFPMKVQLICSADSIYRFKTELKCYMPEPADSLLPDQGESWQFSGKLASIRNSGNPGMPDYRAIMGRKNCWYRFYISSSAISTRFNREVEDAGKKFVSARIRSLVSEHWYGEEKELSLLKAVCLGDRSLLSDDLRQAYAEAGGMHLLAVSGLHVGLVWWVLQYMTGWMSLIFRKGRQQIMLVLGLLWFYAFITGFSSSVCRSVTMFSLFSVSRMKGERSQPLNVIFASAFLLVLINPPRLMDPGFQLSYAAITGIVAFHPLALRLVRVKNRVLRWIWEAASVSLAAQLTTAPLVIYYFHQIPIYSLITSLIAIPLLSILIAIFVCSVPFIAVGILEQFFSYLLMQVARLMNRSVECLSNIPGAVLEELQLDPIGLLVWFLVLLLAMICLHDKKRLPFYLILFSISFSLIWHSFSGLERRSSSELVIAHFRGASHLSFRMGEKVDHYCWYRDSISLDFMKTYRELAWNKRIYKNSLFEADVLDSMPGCAASCIKLREGVWLVGGDGIRGLVLKAPVNEVPLELLFDDLGLKHRTLPDFILLSDVPAEGELQRCQYLEEATFVLDGSMPKWYKQRTLAGWGHAYLTDQAGAYVKRW
jgi:competence protein ComEC